MKFSREAKVGIVVIISIAFLIYGINYLNGIDLFKNSREYYAVYERVDGIVPASPVLYGGMKVGQVTDLTLVQMEYTDSTGKKKKVYRHVVGFIVDNDEFVFAKNSTAKLVSSGFLSNAVEIEPGDGNDLAQPGDTLLSEGQLSLVEKVDAQIAPIKKKAEELLASLDTMVIVVSSVLGENKEDLAYSIESIKKSLRNLQEITLKVNELVDSEKTRISSILDKVNSITGNIQKNNDAINHTINNLHALSDTLVNADIGATIIKLKENLNSFAMILQDVNEGNGTMGKLVNDTTLYNDIRKTNEQLSRLIENIKEHPNRYLHFSVIGRKEKGLKLDAQEEQKLKDLLKKQ